MPMRLPSNQSVAEGETRKRLGKETDLGKEIDNDDDYD